MRGTIIELNAARVTKLRLFEAESIAAKLNHEAADAGDSFIYCVGVADDGESYVVAVYDRNEFLGNL